MLDLAVNDRGDVVLLVLLHGVPHLGDPGAGGVDDVAPPLVEQLHLLNGGAKRRKDHHVATGDFGEVLDPVLDVDEQHVHLPQVVVHRGVVDDLVGDPDPLGGVVLPGLVGHGHGPLDAPAEPEGFRQLHLQAAVLQLIAVFTDAGDQIALVGLLQAAGHLFPQAKAAAVVAIGVMQRSLKRAGIHSGWLEVPNSMSLRSGLGRWPPQASRCCWR